MGILLGQRTHFGQSVVFGTVVDEQNFVVLPDALQNTSGLFVEQRQGFLLVIAGYDDRNHERASSLYR